MIYGFGRYQLDTQTQELHCDGDRCKIEIRAFIVLQYLIEHRDHIVSRDELVDNLWPDHMVSEGIIHNCILAARRTLGDTRSGQETIQTRYGQGYRFVADVEERHAGVTSGTTGSVSFPFLFLEQHADAKGVEASSGRVSSPSTSGPQNVLEEDYRFVTVACGGLTNINGQGGKGGSEVTGRLRQRFFARAHEVTKAYEGSFRFFGAAGFLAIFGWPAVYEDHAQRAIRAGLTLQADLRAHTSGEAPARIGVHAGLMELPRRRDPLSTFLLAASETTACAIRLRHLAKPGMILTSSTTLPFLQESVGYVAHGTVYMPGQCGSTFVYRIVTPAL